MTSGWTAISSARPPSPWATYVINTPLLGPLRLPMQALADRVKGRYRWAWSWTWMWSTWIPAPGRGTLKRPGVGAVRGVLETAMGRAGLAQLDADELQRFLGRVRSQRPEEYARCMDNASESLAHYAARGFAVNMGDSGLGVCAVGAASRIRYGSRRLLFNCAVPGLRMPARTLIRDVGPSWRSWWPCATGCPWTADLWAWRFRRRPARCRWPAARRRRSSRSSGPGHRSGAAPLRAQRPPGPSG